MRILLSNDDGVHAEGLAVLAKQFSRWGTWAAAAPESERSTTGHSLTLHKPLRVRPVRPGFYSVSGGPADCVILGMYEVLKKKPDLVLSGINAGANLGQDVFYSGTVSAAREAAVAGVPAVAISLVLDHTKAGQKRHYSTAAKMTDKVLKKITAQANWKKKWPDGMVLNINVPNLPLNAIKGIRLAHQGRQLYSGDVIKRIDGRGRPYFWVGGIYRGFKPDPHTDCYVVNKGYVSVTPLRLDTTDDKLFTSLHSLFPSP